MKPFHQLISSELIFFIKSQDRDDVIRQLILNVNKVKKIGPLEEFYNAVVTREKVVTTGIGMGVAIPHAKLNSLSDFFIAIGILEKGIDWKSLDGHPVRLVFLIGGPDDKQTQYLKILSSLTLAIKDDETRKQLFNSTTPEEAYASFT
jgi:PTS system nitrogen regulatory IIA component